MHTENVAFGRQPEQNRKTTTTKRERVENDFLGLKWHFPLKLMMFITNYISYTTTYSIKNYHKNTQLRFPSNIFDDNWNVQSVNTNWKSFIACSINITCYFINNSKRFNVGRSASIPAIRQIIHSITGGQALPFAIESNKLWRSETLHFEHLMHFVGMSRIHVSSKGKSIENMPLASIDLLSIQHLMKIQLKGERSTALYLKLCMFDFNCNRYIS